MGDFLFGFLHSCLQNFVMWIAASHFDFDGSWYSDHVHFTDSTNLVVGPTPWLRTATTATIVIVEWEKPKNSTVRGPGIPPTDMLSQVSKCSFLSGGASQNFLDQQKHQAKRETID